MHLKMFTRLYFLLAILFTQKDLTAQIGNGKLSVDPLVKIGHLSNGLTYYIRKNLKPEQKVELRLVVNAGSILEDEDQQGLAHFSEHMAFNGTTNFKRNDMVSFLQSIGVSFGNDLNAYTGFDETVYILPIPTDKPGNIEKGFQVLEDWAHNVTDKPEDIDAERLVVLEESRLGKGADDRVQRKLYPKIFAGSLYANRLPIGIDSIVKTASYSSVRRFYADWYRPDLMAVIVVGDMDILTAENMIRKHFEGMKNPAVERKRAEVLRPKYDKTEALVVTDKEATNYVAEIHYSPVKSTPAITEKEFRNDIAKQIFTTLFNERLRELTQKENPPFLFAATGFDNVARGYESFTAQIVANDAAPKLPLQSFLVQMESIKSYGFNTEELVRAKANLLAKVENAYNERNKTESASLADEYIRNFLRGEPIPGIEQEYNYFKTLLPQISLQDINDQLSFLKQNDNKFISFTGPEVTGKNILPTSDDLMVYAANFDRSIVKANEEAAITSELLAVAPKSGKIISTSLNNSAGTTELILSNGALVTLKKTDFKNDQVVVSVIRGGGKSVFDLKDKYNIEYAAAIISAMGVGNFSPVELRKVLSGHTAEVTPVIGSYSEGFSGSSSAKDLETMMKLLHLYFTASRKDTSLFNSFIQKNKAQIAFLGANPELAFVDTINRLFYHNDPLAPVAIPKTEYFNKISLNRVMQIYKERFGNVNGMHFVFVGSFDLEQMKGLIEKYIGSLSSSAKVMTYRDNKVRPIIGNSTFSVRKGKEQKSLIVRIYSGAVPYDEFLQLKANVLNDILNIRIIEELRQKMQGIYEGSISLQFEKVPYSHYAFFLQIPCGPEKADTLLKVITSEVLQLKKFGPSQVNLDKAKAHWFEAQKIALKDNSAWLAELSENKFPGNDIRYFTEMDKYLNLLSVKNLQDAAKVLFDEKNILTAILKPQAP